MVVISLNSVAMESVFSRCVDALKVTARVAFVALNNIYCIPTYCVWMILLLPLRILYPYMYWKMEGLFYHWLLAMVTMWSWTAGYDIVEMGDDIRVCLKDRTLVIANHQSTSDVPMLMANFNARRDILPNIMWIMDWLFKISNFGIVSILHQDFFILSGKEQRDKGIKELKAHMRNSYVKRDRKFIILFPEGGFLRKRLAASHKYALLNNLPVLNRVTIPRLGAFQAIMDELTPCKLTKYGASENHVSNNNGEVCQMADDTKDKLSWILDITIAYPDNVPLDLLNIITGLRKPCKTYICYRLFPANQVPRDSENMMKWLIERWVEKEKMLDFFYETGEMPYHLYCTTDHPMPPQLVHQDLLRFVILHVFFIASTYVHYQMLYFAYAYFFAK